MAEALTNGSATEGLITSYMRSRGCDRERADATVRFAIAGSGCADVVQFVAVVRLLQNPDATFFGADVVDWFVFTVKMARSPAGREVLRQAGVTMTVVDAPPKGERH